MTTHKYLVPNGSGSFVPVELTHEQVMEIVNRFVSQVEGIFEIYGGQPHDPTLRLIDRDAIRTFTENEPEPTQDEEIERVTTRYSALRVNGRADDGTVLYRINMPLLVAKHLGY